MTKSIGECLVYYTETIDDIDSVEAAIIELKSFIARTEKFSNKDCLVYKNENYHATYQLDGDENIQDALEQIGWCALDDDDKLKLILKCEKKSSNDIHIIDKLSFIATTNDLYYAEQIKLLMSLYHGGIENISINEEMYSLDGYTVSSETKHVIHYRKEQVSDLSENELYPCYIDFLCEKLSNDEDVVCLLKRVRATLCLALLAKKSKLSDEKAIFTFENDMEVSSDIYTDQYLNDNSKIIFDIYKWVYNDEKYVAKVGILWQLLSKSFNANNAFKLDTLSTLQSLYQIYLKEDFEHYIDLRNKVSDSVIELTNKITENIQQSRSGIKQTLFVTMSYFFSIFVFTAIDKGKLDNFLSLPVCILSSLFLIISMIIIIYNYYELQDNITFHKEVLSEVKKRYIFLLSDNEIDSYFNMQSLTKAISSSESKTMVIFSVVCLFIIGGVLWYFFLTKVNLISIPVTLHIV